MKLKKHNDSVTVRMSSTILNRIRMLGYDSISEFIREAVEEKLAIELNQSDELLQMRKKMIRDKINVLKSKIIELEHEKLYHEKKIQAIDAQIEKIRDEIEYLEWLYNNTELRLTESVLETNPDLVQQLDERFKDKKSLLRRLERGEITEYELRNAIKRRLEVCRADTKVPMNKLIQVFKSVHPELANYI